MLQVFLRLAFVTSSIRLEWTRFDTIKTHLVISFHATGLPVTLPRESLSLLLPDC